MMENVEDFVDEHFANLGHHHTGITNIVIRFNYGGGKSPHHARVNISNVYDTFSILDNFTVNIADLTKIGTVKIKKEELKQVLQFITINKLIIEKFWMHADEMITDAIVDSLKKIKVRHRG